MRDDSTGPSSGRRPGAALPVVVVRVGGAVALLDACLAALDRCLPAQARVLLVGAVGADDGAVDPRIGALLATWLATTGLHATHLRTAPALAPIVVLNHALAAAAPADCVLLDAACVPTPGWLARLAECAAADPAIACVVPWSNAGELASYPQFCEPSPPPADADALAAAAAALDIDPVPLPGIEADCVFLRRAALVALGDLDAASYARPYAALNDLALRAAAMGWRSVLCPRAFVARQPTPGDAGAAGHDDLPRLSARWPDWQRQMAQFIMADPLAPARGALRASVDRLAQASPQRDLFGR